MNSLKQANNLLLSIQNARVVTYSNNKAIQEQYREYLDNPNKENLNKLKILERLYEN